MYIAYFDDSGSGGKKTVQVATGVIVRAVKSRQLELEAAACVGDLFSDKDAESFPEFKGTEFFNGKGPFAGIERDRRLTAMLNLVDRLVSQVEAVVYAWVERDKLQASAYKIEPPASVVFAECLPGVEEWMKEHSSGDLCLIVADDTQDRELKDAMKRIFRSERKQLLTVPRDWTFGRLSRVHEEMYFGDSRASIGIQAADVLGYVIYRHLQGPPDADIEQMFGLIEPKIVHACHNEPPPQKWPKW